MRTQTAAMLNRIRYVLSSCFFVAIKRASVFFCGCIEQTLEEGICNEDDTIERVS